MPEPSVLHDTFVIERLFAASPARVFAAFADPVRKRRWFAGEASGEFRCDFRVGGAEFNRSIMGDQTPFPGTPLVSDGVFLDIVTDHRIVMAAAMSLGERRISTALTTYEFRATPTGSTMLFTHQAAFFEGSDGPQMRRAGWEAILSRLDQAVAGE